MSRIIIDKTTVLETDHYFCTLYIFNDDFTLFFCLTSDTSSSSSDSEEGTVNSYFHEENVSDENEDDIDTEPPVFDTSKEIDYKTKYKQTIEEVMSLDNTYILNLDAQKS